MGVAVALILDFQNSTLAQFGGGTRFMIFMLETANTRFGGKTDESNRKKETFCHFRLRHNGHQPIGIGNFDHFRSSDGRKTSNGKNFRFVFDRFFHFVRLVMRD